MNHCITLSLLFLLSVTVGCRGDDPAPSRSEIVGTYRGHYGGGAGTFEIRGDGTFTQTFVAGTNTNSNFILSGKWQFETNTTMNGEWRVVSSNGVLRSEKISDTNTSIKENHIIFHPFMIPGGIAGCVTNTKVDVGQERWFRDPIRIELGPWPYYVAKVKGEGASVK